MNGWYTDLQGSPRYVTMDAAAFAETVAGLLQAGLPFNAGQEFGIYSIQLLMPPPMTDSHETLATAAKPNKGTGLADYAAVPCEECEGAAWHLTGKDRVAEYYRQNSPVDLPDGPTDKRRIGYVGAIDPEWGPDPGPGARLAMAGAEPEDQEIPVVVHMVLMVDLTTYLAALAAAIQRLLDSVLEILNAVAEAQAEENRLRAVMPRRRVPLGPFPCSDKDCNLCYRDEWPNDSGGIF